MLIGIVKVVIKSACTAETNEATAPIPLEEMAVNMEKAKEVFKSSDENLVGPEQHSSMSPGVKVLQSVASARTSSTSSRPTSSKV